MEPMEWVQVLSYVRPEGNRRRSWPTAMVALVRLAGWRGGGILTGPDVAAMAGVSDAAGRRLMLELERQRIVIRDPGAKLKCVRLNDDWRRWRVAWAIPPAAIEAQLALGRQERSQGLIQRISARSKSGRSWDVIARSKVGQEEIQSALENAESARSKSARTGGTDQPSMSAREAKRARAAIERAHRVEVPSGGSHSGENAENVPTSSGRIRSEQERTSDLGGQALVAKILSWSIPAPGARDKWLSGDPLRRLNDMIELHGVELVEQRLERIEWHAHSPKVIVDLLEAHVHLSDDELPTGASNAVEAAPAPEYWTPPEVATPSDAEREAILADLRRSRRPKWQDGATSGEGPEAIAQ